MSLFPEIFSSKKFLNIFIEPCKHFSRPINMLSIIIIEMKPKPFWKAYITHIRSHSNYSSIQRERWIKWTYHETKKYQTLQLYDSEKLIIWIKKLFNHIFWYQILVILYEASAYVLRRYVMCTYITNLHKIWSVIILFA